jgi:hypothetical protein
LRWAQKQLAGLNDILASDLTVRKLDEALTPGFLGALLGRAGHSGSSGTDFNGKRSINRILKYRRRKLEPERNGQRVRRSRAEIGEIVAISRSSVSSAASS